MTTTSIPPIQPDRALEVIHAMMIAYIREHRIEPTTLLVDPRLWREMLVANDNPFGPVNGRKTVFGLAVIEVYKPYPFLAICHLMDHSE